MKVLGQKRPVDLGHETLLEEAKAVTLRCGHAMRGVSIVTYPDGRKGYMCPQGCGIQKAKRR